MNDVMFGNPLIYIYSMTYPDFKSRIAERIGRELVYSVSFFK
jgi:hypothetical protein